MHYQEIDPLDRRHLDALFHRGQPEEVPPALVAAAFHNADWGWAQNWCLYFARSPHGSLRTIAAVCLGHLARIHRTLNLEVCLPVLVTLKEDADPAVRGGAADALDDIALFVPRQ
jgi:hypothetical protein